MSNFIPFIIINLQGNIYQLVDKETEIPIHQGTWHECAHHLKNILSKELEKILFDSIRPN